MAISDLGVMGTNSTKTAGTTLDIINQSGAAIPAGTLLFICFGCDNIASATAPTLTLSNVGGVAPTSNHAAVGSGVTTTAGSGVWHQCWRVVTTAAIADTAAITTITSNQSNVVRAAVCKGWSGASTTLQGAVVTATSTAGTPSAATGVTQPLTGNLVVGCIVGENNANPTADADTTNGSWSSISAIATTGGGAATNLTAGIQSKIVTAGGGQTYNPVTVADSVACITCVTQTPAPGVASAPTASIAGLTERVDVTTPAAYPSNATSWIIRYGIDSAPGSNLTGVVGLSATSSHTGLSPLSSYQYLMQATGVGGTTDGTASTGVVPNPAPPVFTVSPGNTIANLHIFARSYAAKYKVYRRVTSVGGAYTLVHTSASQGASGTYDWQDTGLTNGVSYDYVVTTEAQTPTVRESAQPTAQAVTPSTAVPYSPLVNGDNAGIDGTTRLGLSSGYKIGQETSVAKSQAVRFPGIAVAQGAPITATLRYYILSITATPTDNVTAVASDDVTTAFQTDSGATILAYPRGTQSVPMIYPAPGNMDIDVTAMVQEVINRPGWASGNAMALIFEKGSIIGDQFLNVGTLNGAHPMILTIDTAVPAAMPAAISRTVSIPTPTVSTPVDALVSAAVISRTVSITAPTLVAGTGATAAPAVISRSVSIPTPGVGIAVSVAPGVIAGAASFPSPTVVAPAPALITALVISGSVNLPAAAVVAGTGAAASPAVISRLVSIGAVTPIAGVGATASPATIARTVSFGAPTPAAPAAPTPATITRTVTIPTPPVTAGTGASASPLVVAGQVSLPAHAAGSGAGLSPGVIAGLVSLPSPTIAAATGAAATPGTIAGTVTVGSPTVVAGAGTLSTPAVVLGSVSFPPPVSGAGFGAQPAAITGSVSFPAPSVAAGGSATAVPAAVLGAVSFPSPIRVAGVGALPAAIVGQVTFPARTVVAGQGASASPSTIAPPATTFGTPQVGQGVTSTPLAIITSPASIPIPAITAGIGAAASPATISRTVNFPAPSASAGGSAGVGPATITGVAAFGAAVVRSGVTAVPAAISRLVSIPTPGVVATTTVNVTPATISRTVVIGIATIAHGARTTPNTILGSVSIPAPSVLAGGAAVSTPNTILGSATLPGPSVVAGFGVSTTPGAIFGSVVIGGVGAGAGQGAQVAPATIFGQVQIGISTILTEIRVAPATIQVSVTIPTPGFTIGLPLPQQVLGGQGAVHGFQGSVVVLDPLTGIILPHAWGGTVRDIGPLRRGVT